VIIQVQGVDFGRRTTMGRRLHHIWSRYSGQRLFTSKAVPPFIQAYQRHHVHCNPTAGAPQAFIGSHTPTYRPKVWVGMRSPVIFRTDHNLEVLIKRASDTRSPFYTSTLYRYILNYNLQLLTDSFNPNPDVSHHIYKTTRLLLPLSLFHPLIHISLSPHLTSPVSYTYSYSVSCTYTHIHQQTCHTTSLGLLLKMKRKRR
jgi:hypothetical protein